MATFGLGLMITTYICFIILVVVFASRAGRVATLPTPIRWEIYPVPHEEPEKAHRGSSYYEDLEWWKKPRHLWHAGELKETLKEMLFMVRLFERKRIVWIFSYPFHVGIYLILAWIVLLFIGAITEICGLPVAVPASTVHYTGPLKYLIIGNFAPFNHPWSIFLYVVTMIAGYVGAACLIFGCVGLIVLRFAKSELRRYARFADYFNLFFILAVVVSGWVAAAYDPTFTIAREYMRALLTFTPVEYLIAKFGITGLPPAVSVQVVIFEVFLAYYPFTRMIHGPLKYVSYHKVAWDNAPRIPGVRIGLDALVNKYLDYVLTWEGPHVPKGHKWRDLRTVWPEVRKT